MGNYYCAPGLYRSANVKNDLKRIVSMLTEEMDGTCVYAYPDQFMESDETVGNAFYLINSSAFTVHAEIGTLGESPAGYIKLETASKSKEELTALAEQFNTQFPGILRKEPLEIKRLEERLR